MKKLLLNTLLLLLTLGAFSQSSYEVNTYYKELGGYVISVYDDGAHGTVVAMQDQALTTALYWNAQTKASNPDNHDKAGKAVKGWRLPTFEELTLMHTVYKNGNAPQFNISEGADQTESSKSYWSITAKQDGSIFLWDFANGAQFYAAKTQGPYNVRAVRDF